LTTRSQKVGFVIFHFLHPDSSLATGGRNGYGAKLANIFSTAFEVEIWDPERGLHYKQTWNANMTRAGKPEIAPLASTERSGTRVSFVPDLQRFSSNKAALKPKADILQVFRTRCYDIAACNPGLAVSFNGKEVPSSFEEYFKLFDLHTMGSVFARLPNGWQVGVGVVESPSASGAHVSFVNSINTLRGGTHVSHILEQICKGVAAAMKKDSSLPAVQPAFIRSHLVLFVNSLVPNPTFDSQTKETLTTSADVIRELCDVPQAFVQKVRESGV
jgi:DNA topoisomerase-2